MSIYFISGIDTGIGKTIATGVMATALHRSGHRVITAKLIQTGNDGFSEDLDMHRNMMKCPPFPEDCAGLTAPQIFHFPASPHLAAALEKRAIDFAKIDQALKTLAQKYEIVLLEGAGGLMVPLTEDLLTIDWAAERNYPLLLVTSGRLGSLNHTLLSIEAAARRGMKLSGVLYNWCADSDPVIEEDSCRMIGKYLKKYGYSPTVVKIPHYDGSHVPGIDVTPIFKGEASC